MPFPAVIDNVIRKAFATCPASANYEFVERLRPPDSGGEHLLFGRAFAKGLETARQRYFAQGFSTNVTQEIAVEAALGVFGNFVPANPKSVKTRERLLAAIDKYFEVWPLDAEYLEPIVGGIEKSFAVPLPFAHPDTGEVLQYAGRFDLLAHDGDKFIVHDDKTASGQGDLWAWQWDMDSQMTGYIWAIRQQLMGDESPEAAMLPEVRGNVRAVFVRKYDIGHMEVPIVRADWQIEQWYNQLLRDVARMLFAYESGIWDMAMTANACTRYGRQCEFTRLCTSPNPKQLYGTYELREWNPLDPKD